MDIEYKASDFDMTEEQFKRMFEELKAVEGFLDYLKDMTNKDVARYFGVSSDKERDQVRGSYGRTQYLIARVVGNLQKK